MHSGTASAATCLDFCRVSRIWRKNVCCVLRCQRKPFYQPPPCGACRTLKVQLQHSVFNAGNRCQHTSQQPR